MDKNINKMWERVSESVNKVFEEVVGEWQHNMPEVKQTWLWRENVQGIISNKNMLGQ